MIYLSPGLSRLFSFSPTSGNALAKGPETEAYKMANEISTGRVNANEYNVGELMRTYVDEGGDAGFMSVPKLDASSNGGARPDTVVPSTNTDVQNTADGSTELTESDIKAQVQQAVEDSIRENANNPATAPKVKTPLANGMGALIYLEVRLQSDSGNINYSGFKADTSNNAYVDFLSRKGSMEAAAQAMAAEVRAAIATGQLTAGEVVRLQGVLAGLTGSSVLAEEYVGQMVAGINAGTVAVPEVAPRKPVDNIDRGRNAGDNVVKSKYPLPTTPQEFYPYTNEIGKRTDLTIAEKVQIEQDAYEMLGDGNRKDILVPADKKFLKANGFDERGRPDYDWPERWGMKDGTIEPIESSSQLPHIIDKDGQLSGNSVSPLKENGEPYSYDEKSIPYMPNPEAKHQAVIKGQYYIELINAIKANDLNALNTLLIQNGIEGITQDEMKDLVNQYKFFINSAKARVKNADATYGFHGIADKWEKNGEVYLTGGAPQFTFPISVEYLIQFGIYK